MGSYNLFHEDIMSDEKSQCETPKTVGHTVFFFFKKYMNLRNKTIKLEICRTAAGIPRQKHNIMRGLLMRNLEISEKFCMNIMLLQKFKV